MRMSEAGLKKRKQFLGDVERKHGVEVVERWSRSAGMIKAVNAFCEYMADNDRKDKRP